MSKVNPAQPIAQEIPIPFKVECIGADSPLLKGVLALHAVSKARLGPLPTGAFEERAKLNHILVALAPDGSLAGYLLYRVAKRRAAITHLTSAEQFRGTGVAQLLIDRLKGDTSHLLGISLNCRRDYRLEGMWSKFGFTVRNTKTGRGADGALLDLWWFGHNHEDLFSIAATREEASQRVTVAIDANVFYDLTVDGRPHGEDTRMLEADWLDGCLELCITPELFNEIHRADSASDQQRSRGAAQGFRELKTDESRTKLIEAELKPLFNNAICDRDRSDMRQVAHAIAAEVAFLVTRDAGMLSHADRIFERYGLRILHPTDLIVRFDNLRREAEYRPVRLEGSRWRERLVTEADIPHLCEVFHQTRSERLHEFESRLRHHLAHPDTSACRLAVDDTYALAVLLVQTRTGDAALEIAFLRHSNHPLAGTLIRHMLHAAVLDTAQGTSNLLSVSDKGVSEVATSAMQELGFLTDGEAWWKLSLAGVVNIKEATDAVCSSGLPPSLKGQLASCVLAATSHPDLAIRCEQSLAPVKIVDINLPSFVVPIFPDWAEHFFDAPTGGQLWMDLKERLHLGIEGAYYCSGKNRHLRAPARILWYVSQGPSGRGAMEVKACSHLAEIVVGKPKELYRKFRHLGVFEWKDVFARAKNDLDATLLAFRFSRTERFARPVSLAEIKELAVPQPVNPRRITNDQFVAIYQLGMNHSRQ